MFYYVLACGCPFQSTTAVMMRTRVQCRYFYTCKSRGGSWQIIAERLIA